MNLITKLCIVIGLSSLVIADIGLDLQKRGNYNYNAPTQQFQDNGASNGASYNAASQNGASHNGNGASHSNGANQIASSSYQTSGFGNGGSAGFQSSSNGNGFNGGSSSSFSSQSSSNGNGNGFSNDYSSIANSVNGASNGAGNGGGSNGFSSQGFTGGNYQSSGITTGTGFQSSQSDFGSSNGNGGSGSSSSSFGSTSGSFSSGGAGSQGPVSNGVQLGPTYSGNVPECKKCQLLLDDVQEEVSAPALQANVAQEVEHQKHIYVFGAEDEDQEQAVQAQTPAPKKTVHHKIIFIKAPYYNTAAQQIAAQQAQREEKTIVYVLVKKPEDIKQVAQVQEQQFTPQRPEVFFIKYKGQQNQAQASSQSTTGISGFTSGQIGVDAQQGFAGQHSTAQQGFVGETVSESEAPTDGAFIGGEEEGHEQAHESEEQFEVPVPNVEEGSNDEGTNYSFSHSSGSYQDAPASESLSDSASFNDQPTLLDEDIRIDDKPAPAPTSAPANDASKDYLPPQLRRKRKPSRAQ